MNPLTEIQNDISGMAALADWLGDAGEPAHPMVAAMRASRCVEANNGEPCPMNRAPKWWEKAKEIPARWMRKELELKNHMKLRVPQEDRLHMCAACGCCLPLKVWAPRSLIRDHTTQKQLAQMPDYCWIKKELA